MKSTRHFGLALVCGLGLLTGCGTWSSAQKGTAIGVGLGGAAGAAATGSAFGTVGGAALGGSSATKSAQDRTKRGDRRAAMLGPN
jgi:hypothetical protein